MILHSSNDESFHAMLSGDSSDIFTKPTLNLRRNSSAAVLSREHAVKQ